MASMPKLPCMFTSSMYKSRALYPFYWYFRVWLNVLLVVTIWNAVVELIFVFNVEVCKNPVFFEEFWFFGDAGKWDTNQGNYKCLRGCELWEDDEQLLDEDQREGRRLLPQVDPPAIDAIELPNVFMAPPPYNPPHYQAVELEWIYDDGMI